MSPQTQASKQRFRKFLQSDIFSHPLAEMGRSVLLTTAVVSSLVLGIRYVGRLQSMELAVYDQLVRTRPDEGEDRRLLVVGITETDVQRLQEWPLSDQTLTKLLVKLQAAKPRVVGIDVIRDVPIGQGHAQLLQRLRQQNVFVVCKASSPTEPGIAPPKGVSPDFIGFADLVVDPGGTLRRSLLLLNPTPGGVTLLKSQHFCNDPKNTLVSFGLQLTLSYLQRQGIQAQFTPEGSLKIGSQPVPKFQQGWGGYQAIDDGGYQILLNYRSADRAARQVKLMDILDGKVSPDLIRDRIVLIGYTTPAAKDEFYTPYSGEKADNQKMAGVMVHAQAVSQLLSFILNQRPLLSSWPDGLEALWTVGWSLVGGLLAWYIRRPIRFILLAVGGGSLLYGACFLFLVQGVWVPLVPPFLTLVLTAGGVILIERFNRSDYGQAVYRQVKHFLKLDIEIDQGKVDEQVAEITESDYFLELQQSVKSLRTQSSDNPEHAPARDSASSTGLLPPLRQVEHVITPDDPVDGDKDGEDELDYFNQLKRETDQLRQLREPGASQKSD